jgi:hypothetical protein
MTGKQNGTLPARSTIYFFRLLRMSPQHFGSRNYKMGLGVGCLRDITGCRPHDTGSMGS